MVTRDSWIPPYIIINQKSPNLSTIRKIIINHLTKQIVNPFTNHHQASHFTSWTPAFPVPCFLSPSSRHPRHPHGRFHQLRSWTHLLRPHLGPPMRPIGGEGSVASGRCCERTASSQGGGVRHCPRLSTSKHNRRLVDAWWILILVNVACSLVHVGNCFMLNQCWWILILVLLVNDYWWLMAFMDDNNNGPCLLAWPASNKPLIMVKDGYVMVAGSEWLVIEERNHHQWSYNVLQVYCW